MKLLFDQNLSFKHCELLADLFPNSSHVRLLGLHRADDRAIWRFAGANDFMIVSLDADFSEMAALLGPPPKVIWLRSGNQSTMTVERILRNRAAAIKTFASGDAACLEVY
jgi:predicted nuclease of predicted toxin-antitoxin system